MYMNIHNHSMASCTGQQPILRSKGFSWNNVLLPTCSSGRRQHQIPTTVSVDQESMSPVVCHFPQLWPMTKIHAVLSCCWLVTFIDCSSYFGTTGRRKSRRGVGGGPTNPGSLSWKMAVNPVCVAFFPELFQNGPRPQKKTFVGYWSTFFTSQAFPVAESTASKQWSDCKLPETAECRYNMIEKKDC